MLARSDIVIKMFWEMLTLIDFIVFVFLLIEYIL